MITVAMTHLHLEKKEAGLYSGTYIIERDCNRAGWFIFSIDFDTFPFSSKTVFQQRCFGFAGFFYTNYGFEMYKLHKHSQVLN